MIPLWFLPYAIACGNSVVLKPSEKAPLTMQKLFTLIEQIDLPPGVINLVNGSKETVDTLLDHEDIRAVSFVGSTPVAKYVYARATANGKRAQCQGGAKNYVVIMPDADLEAATKIVNDSAFGCAGQRCLAVSIAVTVGDAQNKFREAIAHSADSLNVGCGLDDGVQMGPVISAQSKAYIEQCIAEGISEGANPIRDGRGIVIPGYENGNFIGPTVLDGVSPEGKLADTEIFGPVIGLAPAPDLDTAIEIISRCRYGNAASIFTTSGLAARRFRYEVPAGNIGVNIGIAAPMAFFPFSGWKESFFGTLHAQGKDAVEFYTDKKVVIERWPEEWSRKF
jgi:malonate-semialdehyde dehydrogenase (acetylating)/methylmalonate-semialdehyde dehydrogenase